MSDSLRPHGVCSPWNSPDPNSGVGSLSFLQGIFPTQGSNPGLPHCRQILYQLSYQGSPWLLGGGLKKWDEGREVLNNLITDWVLGRNLGPERLLGALALDWSSCLFSTKTLPNLKDQPQPSILASSHLPGSSDHPCNSKILDPSSRPQPFAALGGIISFYKATGEQLRQISGKKNLGVGGNKLTRRLQHQLHACVLSHVHLSATLWTAACQAPLSMGFSRQEYWSGLPCPHPGDLPDPGIKASAS